MRGFSAEQDSCPGPCVPLRPDAGVFHPADARIRHTDVLDGLSNGVTNPPSYTVALFIPMSWHRPSPISAPALCRREAEPSSKSSRTGRLDDTNTCRFSRVIRWCFVMDGRNLDSQKASPTSMPPSFPHNALPSSAPPRRATVAPLPEQRFGHQAASHNRASLCCSIGATSPGAPSRAETAARSPGRSGPRSLPPSERAVRRRGFVDPVSCLWVSSLR
ncbi:hypothetical protein SAMN04487820_105231 [Actinopolyspora mzabensis]|uniref:Uncharacterized protein n=1 Tax=Actinopolyspora mzabensis TaxID=995066 RepID=A0A1G9A2K4_ACTMZ|nr:hypothetical protein SAMN04487820_105231 [Actinopolyspora mzabensis]